MNGCYCSQGGMIDSCSCGFYESQSNSFSVLFAPQSYGYDDAESYQFYSQPPPSASVDCTLSLGTPSTRLTENRSESRRSGGSYQSELCTGWDTNILQPKRSPSLTKSGKGLIGNGGSSGDPLVARRCTNCDTTSTPLWRNGPRGPKSLCNACGIRFKKEEKRAAASSTTAKGVGAVGMIETTQHTDVGVYQNDSWAHQYSPAQYVPPAMPAESGYMDDDDRDAFLSWRLSVADMSAQLVQDYN